MFSRNFDRSSSRILKPDPQAGFFANFIRMANSEKIGRTPSTRLESPRVKKEPCTRLASHGLSRKKPRAVPSPAPRGDPFRPRPRTRRPRGRTAPSSSSRWSSCRTTSIRTLSGISDWGLGRSGGSEVGDSLQKKCLFCRRYFSQNFWIVDV